MPKTMFRIATTPIMNPANVTQPSPVSWRWSGWAVVDMRCSSWLGVLRSAVQQPDGAAADDRLGPRRDVELAVHGQRLRLHGVGRDVQALSDLAEREVAREEAQDA